MEVPRLPIRPGQRPVGRVAPFVRAHEEHLHRGLLVDAVARVAEPAVEPAGLEPFEVEHRARPEVHVAGLRRTAQVMRPGPDHQPALRGQARPLGPDPVEAVERVAGIEVVPAAGDEGGHAVVGPVAVEIERRPPVVLGLVLDPVPPVRDVLRRRRRRLDEGQGSKCLAPIQVVDSLPAAAARPEAPRQQHPRLTAPPR